MNIPTLLALGFVIVSGSARAQVRSRISPAQQALERMQKDQADIQKLSMELKQALLELNRLRQIPPNDPNYKNVPATITQQNLKILTLTAAICVLVQGDGLASAIVGQQESVRALLAKGLSPSELQVLVDAGFTPTDIADLSITIQMRGADDLGHLDPVVQIKRIESPEGKSQADIVKIGAGGLLIGVDIGSRFIPFLNVVTAFEAFTSVSEGVVLVEEGLQHREPQPR